VSTSDIIAIAATGFAVLSALLGGWAAHTAHEARKWQRELDAEQNHPARLASQPRRAGDRRAGPA